MPAVERTTQEAIVAAARALLDDGGPDAITMSAVAAAVGVRAPSLYKRVRDRDELVALVAVGVVADLGRALREASSDDADPIDALRAVIDAFRAYALTHPWAYRLVLGALPASAVPSIDALAEAVAPALDPLRALVGPEWALDAARTVTAWAHGFALMELSGAFRLGGNVDDAFAWGRETLLGALRAE